MPTKNVKAEIIKAKEITGGGWPEGEKWKVGMSFVYDNPFYDSTYIEVYAFGKLSDVGVAIAIYNEKDDSWRVIRQEKY